MATCNVCGVTRIGECVVDLLEWEATSIDQIVACAKCVATFSSSGGTYLKVHVARKSASLVEVMEVKE